MTKWENILLLILILIAPFLLFYNLGHNPRPWHDEGAALSVAKTLAQEGKYAIKNSDGYQTFGPIQSIGPTVLLPVALVYKVWGVGLLQGRIVAAIYALITLVLFYICGRVIFNSRIALIAVIISLSSPAVGFLLYGRQVVGEIPAFGFFLGGVLAWVQAVKTSRRWLYIIAGLSFGLSMITKSNFMIIGFGTLAVLVLIDLFYYRLGMAKYLILVGFIAVVCVSLWFGWQMMYFGMDTFGENLRKLGELAWTTTGFNIHSFVDAVQYLVGSGSGHFYLFWGYFALLYIGFQVIKRNIESFILMFLFAFTCLGLLYFMFWSIPWPNYLIAPAAFAAYFTSKLICDLSEELLKSRLEFWSGIKKSLKNGKIIDSKVLLFFGTSMALVSMGFWMLYNFQRFIRFDVLSIGSEDTDNIGGLHLPQLDNPEQAAEYLKNNIDKNAVIETWERELGILTDNNFHYPDQSMLAKAQLHVYREGPDDYTLGAEYFSKVRPAYVVVGWYARLNDIYSQKLLKKNANLIATIGEGKWSYEVYKLDLTSLLDQGGGNGNPSPNQ